MLGILLLMAIVSAFFIALFLRNKRKMFVSLIFTCIGGITLLVLFTNIGVLPYAFSFVSMPVIIAIMLLCKGEGVPWICWSVSVLLIGLMVFTGLASLAGYEISCMFSISLPRAMTDTLFFYNSAVLMPCITFLVLMVVMSIIRIKRRKLLWADENSTSGKSTKTQDGYYSRLRHNGCVKIGNVISVISYILMLSGIRILYGDRVDINPLEFLYLEGNSPVGLSIALIVISLLCGFVAWLLLRYAMEYGYETGAITKAIYIWSWIPAIIIIALIIVTILIICAFTDVEFSTVANKRVYKVIDENGEVRILDYNGKDIYSKCKDDKGEWWETADGGSTFRKCDLYKIKDDDGNDKYIRDVSGGGKRIFTDGQGGTYESEDGGMTVTEQKD